jgi:hypothetical protein
VTRLIFALVATALLVAAQAEAACPTLVSFGHVRGHPAATWRLAPGVEPQPPPKPRYEALVVSTHPNAVRVPGSRKWTYRGDTVAITFRNFTAEPGARQPYRVCWTGRFGPCCRTRTLSARARDTWRMRLLGKWVGYRGKRYVRYIEFSWHVGERTVAKRRVWVWE